MTTIHHSAAGLIMKQLLPLLFALLLGACASQPVPENRAYLAPGTRCAAAGTGTRPAPIASNC